MKTKSALLATLLYGLTAASSHAVTIYGLGTDGTLYSFDTASPGTFNTIGTPANGIVDIDFRGSDSRLYGLSGTGNAYTINLGTGASTLVPGSMVSLMGQVSGFDVNPVANRFRIVTDAAMGNNYRLTPETNTLTADGTFSAGTAILDVAYTNPFSAGTTALYSIGADGNLYQHFTQFGDPAGSFNGRNASGSLGLGPIDASGGFAFDIAQAGNTGYFSIGTSLYSISNVGESAPSVSSLGTLAQPLASFSAVPEPSAALLACLAGLGFLRRRR